MKLFGYLEIKNGVRIHIPGDFCRYYKHLIDVAHYRTVRWECPRHGNHISLYLPNIHGENPKRNLFKLNQNEKIYFEVDPLALRSGGRNFTNWWFPVKCPRGEEIKKEIGIIENSKYLGLHIVVCNSKLHDDYK